MSDETMSREQFLKIRTYFEDRLTKLSKEKEELQIAEYETKKLLKDHIKSCNHSNINYFNDRFNTCNICGKALRTK